MELKQVGYATLELGCPACGEKINYLLRPLATTSVHQVGECDADNGCGARFKLDIQMHRHGRATVHFQPL